MKERRSGHHWAPPDFRIRNRTRDLVGRNRCLVLPHASPPHTQLVARPWRHPHLLSLLMPCAAPTTRLHTGASHWQASATHRGLITRESEKWAAVLQPPPVREMEGGDREAECKQHITLGLDTQMHHLPPPAGSSVLLGHFHLVTLHSSFSQKSCTRFCVLGEFFVLF